MIIYKSSPTFSAISTQPGTATPGNDYVTVDGPLEFSPDSDVAIVNITILPDDEFESDETFTVVISDPSHGYIGEDSEALISILGEKIQSHYEGVILAAKCNLLQSS